MRSPSCTAGDTVGKQLPLGPQRLRRAKKSYTTRDVAAAVDAHPEGYHVLTGSDVAAGGLAGAVTEQHDAVEDPTVIEVVGLARRRSGPGDPRSARAGTRSLPHRRSGRTAGPSSSRCSAPR